MGPFIQYVAELGAGIIKVPEGQGPFFACLNACGHPAHGKEILTEVAFFHYPALSRGVPGIDPLYKGSWITEVEAPGAIWACGHTEATAYAAMVVYHDDPVFGPLKSSLGRACPDTGRVIAVVAQEQKPLLPQSLRNQSV